MKQNKQPLRGLLGEMSVVRSGSSGRPHFLLLFHNKSFIQKKHIAVFIVKQLQEHWMFNLSSL